LKARLILKLFVGSGRDCPGLVNHFGLNSRTWRQRACHRHLSLEEKAEKKNLEGNEVLTNKKESMTGLLDYYGQAI
jgi:hypothetical protein